jgi:predicted RNA-binding Zn-ribbon protein involved in translation (DUF1610 family)
MSHMPGTITQGLFINRDCIQRHRMGREREMKYTIRMICAECERYRRFQLVMGTTSSWYECPKCGESVAQEVVRPDVKRAGRVS